MQLAGGAVASLSENLGVLDFFAGSGYCFSLVSNVQVRVTAFLVVQFVERSVSHFPYRHDSKLSLGLKSHKGSNNVLLNFYYSFPFLLIFCSGNELFFTMSYLLAFTEGPVLHFGDAKIGLFLAVAYVCFPLFVWKNFMNLVQMCDAAAEIAALPEQTTDQKNK